MVASKRLRCAECACLSDTGAEGWTGFLTEDAVGLEPTGLAVFVCEDTVRVGAQAPQVG